MVLFLLSVLRRYFVVIYPSFVGVSIGCVSLVFCLCHLAFAVERTGCIMAVVVLCLFLMVPLDSLQSVIVAFLGDRLKVLLGYKKFFIELRSNKTN